MSALEIVMVSLVSVFVFSFLLYIFLIKYYRHFSANRVNDFLLMDQVKENKKIVFLGDSLTDFYNIPEFLDGDYGIVNRGVAGDTTFDVLKRIDEVTSLKPEKLFLQIGINDLIKKGKRVKPHELTNRIIKIASMFECSKIYIISLYPINFKKMKLSWFFCGKARNKYIVKINEILKEKAKERNYEFIDLYPELLDENNNLKKEYTLEGLHLTTLAYVEITKKLKDFIRE